MQRRYWHNAQLLRLVAAFSIVYVHLEVPFVRLGGDPRLVSILRFGTDMFLTLAGFLSAYIVLTGRRTAGDYLWGRILRIVPLFWIVTVAAFFAKNGLMGEAGRSDLEQLLKSLLFIPYGPYPVLHPTWSLTLIMEFAVLLSAGVALSRRWGGWIAAGAALALAAAGHVTHPASPMLRMYTSPFLVNFAVGAVMAIGVARYDTPARRAAPAPALVPVGAGLIALALVALLSWPFLWLDGARLLVVGVPGFALLAGIFMLELAGVAFRSKRVDAVSELAFAVYLTHVFWNVTLIKVAAHVSPAATTALLIATPVPVLLLAWLVHHRLERPITRRLRQMPAWGIGARQPGVVAPLAD